MDNGQDKGFKPPYGRVPETPPYNLDHYCHEGPMARTVSDCALLENVIAGPHPSDVASLRPKLRLSLAFPSIKAWKIALCLNLGDFNVADDVVANTLAAARSRSDRRGSRVAVAEGGDPRGGANTPLDDHGCLDARGDTLSGIGHDYLCPGVRREKSHHFRQRDRRRARDGSKGLLGSGGGAIYAPPSYLSNSRRSGTGSRQRVSGTRTSHQRRRRAAPPGGADDVALQHLQPLPCHERSVRTRGRGRSHRPPDRGPHIRRSERLRRSRSFRTATSLARRQGAKAATLTRSIHYVVAAEPS